MLSLGDGSAGGESRQARFFVFDQPPTDPETGQGSTYLTEKSVGENHGLEETGAPVWVTRQKTVRHRVVVRDGRGQGLSRSSCRTSRPDVRGSRHKAPSSLHSPQ